MHTVIETQTFLRHADKQGMSEKAREELVTLIAECPKAGDVIRGSGGCRKVRFGGKGNGKSGGFRVITFYSGGSLPVFLLTVYAKGKLGNLTNAQMNILNALTRTLVKEYTEQSRRA